MKIRKIQGFIIKDSRQKETIKVKIFSEGYTPQASVPSGKSLGTHEARAVEPRVALEKLNLIEKKIKDTDFKSPFDFDKFLLRLDGSKDKRSLGANTILALSMAFWRLFAQKSKIPLYSVIQKLTGIRSKKFPFLFFNLINGGVHAKNSLPFQEYLIIPQVNLPLKSLKICFDFINDLKIYFKKNNINLRFGDEGGFVVDGNNPEIGLEILNNVLKKKDYPIKIGLDVAASSLTCEFSSTQLFHFYKDFSEKYPLFSIEDPFGENDFQNFAKLNQGLGKKIWIIGDDLTATNLNRIKIAKQKKAINTLLIKPNQIGSISETIEATSLAKSFGFKTIISHRSGETMDDFIADLAFGVGADGLKSGSPLQKQRLVKYQRLIEIEKNFLAKCKKVI